MADPRVVEELLEKGAQAGAVALANVSNLPEWMQVAALGRSMTPIARLAVEAAFDAVLPGWREGIREFGYRDPNSEHTWTAISFLAAEALAEDRSGVAWSRWCGPWLPVEDGTT